MKFRHSGTLTILEFQKARRVKMLTLSIVGYGYFQESPNTVGNNSIYLLAFSIQKKTKHHMRHSFLKL